MAWIDFIYAALAIFAGSIVQTLTGVGTGFLMVPVIALIDMALLPGPMVMASMSLSGLMAFRGRRHIDYKNVAVILCGIVPGAVIGADELKLGSVHTPHVQHREWAAGTLSPNIAVNDRQ